jgi:hypothetical protein
MMSRGDSKREPLLHYTEVYAVAVDAVSDSDYYSSKERNIDTIVEPSHVQLRHPAQSIAQYESLTIEKNILDGHFDGVQIVRDENRACIASQYEARHISHGITAAIHSCVTEDRLDPLYIPVSKCLPSGSAPLPEYSLSSPNGYKMTEYISNYEIGAASIGATQSEYKVNEYKSVYEK